MKLRSEKFSSIIIKMQQWSKRGDFIEVAPGWFENAQLIITEEVAQLEIRCSMFERKVDEASAIALDAENKVAQLEAENERLREALRKVRDEADGDTLSFEAYCIADKALGGER